MALESDKNTWRSILEKRISFAERIRRFGNALRHTATIFMPKAKQAYGKALETVLPESVSSSHADTARFKKAFSFFLGYIFIILALITVISTLAVRKGKSVTLPKVENRDIIEGTEELRKHGFPVTVETRVVPGKERGIIVSQTPRGGSFVKKGRVVKLFVNRGSAFGFMPAFVGTKYLTALTEISNTILKRNSNVRIAPPVFVMKSGVAGGTIMEQSPPARAEIADYTSISFVVNAANSGEKIAVEDYTGRNFTEVLSLLEASGIVVNIASEEVTDKKLANTVMSQSMKTGELKPGATIDLTVGMLKRDGYRRMSVSYKRFFFDAPNDEKTYTLRVELADNFGTTVKYNNKIAGGEKVAFTYSVYGTGTLTVYLNDREYEKKTIE
ncbi:MAG: PASTA domain-containing protein [Spirochaetes bacterium]|nr:PASTA domain-containing protein [Spirochaetota bacterium]